jgi:hypothetical protein
MIRRAIILLRTLQLDHFFIDSSPPIQPIPNQSDGLDVIGDDPRSTLVGLP